MEGYVKEMKIYRCPRGAGVSSYEDFEIFILQLLAETPVMVTIEYLPCFESFDGQVSHCLFFSCLIYYLLELILSMKTFNLIGNFQSIRHGLSLENI